MSLSEFFRDGEKAIDLTEDPEEELEKMNYLRPGKMMMADTNVVKVSEGRWMMIAEGSSKKGKKAKEAIKRGEYYPNGAYLNGIFPKTFPLFSFREGKRSDPGACYTHFT